MRRAEQFAVEAVRPAVHRTDDARPGVAAALEYDRLAMAADVADEFDAVLIVHQRVGIAVPLERVIVAAVRRHQRVAAVTRATFEQQLLLERINLRIEVPVNGKLRGGVAERAQAGEV